MIILFDIDGTLVSGTVGRRAFSAALAEALDSPDPLREISLHGSVDRQIVRDAAQAHGRWPATPAAQRELVERVLARYREVFDAEIPALPYRALPAAAECVRAAGAACELVGLATGNIERCAHSKLRSAGLGELFAGCAGGYGDDADVRDEVVRVAIRRARARGARGERVLVVGDTPRDVAAGHAAGALVAAVATGRYSAAELAASGADAVYADLLELAAAQPWG